MNVGSRVQTPEGPGTLIRLVIDERWAFRRPNVITWAAVKLDDKPYPQMFHPAHIKEAPMNETTTEPDTDTEPDPTPPQPEPPTGDDDDEKLVEFPE